MKQSLQLRIGQSLTMTPQLQQAIKLLQLSSLELQAEIQETLDANPLLEQEDNLGEITVFDTDASSGGSNSEDSTDFKLPNPVSENRAQQTLPDELEIDARWEHIYDNLPGSSTQSATSGIDNRDMFENQSGAEDTLKNHLTWQLDCAHISEIDHDIGLAIIDAINDSGYLSDSIEDIYEGLAQQHENLELDEVEAVLHLVQRFDPVGVAAKSPSECMTIQLEQYDPETPCLAKAKVLVDKYLEHLASNDVALLKRRLQASDSELAEIIKLIQTTNPHPGHSISQNHAEYVVPDVYVSKQSGRWRVSINPEHAPRLRVNDQYASLIKRSDTSDQNTYLKDHLQEARWFIKSLQSRNETLLRVATAIVERQHAFLEYGEEAMQPMVLRDIAEQLELHESTISRVTTHKYMHTPRGILEFKYFFSSHVGTADGGECSATAIRAIIKKFVAAEKPEKPLSDNKIATLLEQQGINVARRTVAKYREALNIPPSNERKRLF
ncbi:MAG: RNA polymerase factor sigma-54 [Gammaproteobacteria bacterium]|nr:RNA polymerase factor sigma-54 [Gammaproteobacteria bacterium]MDH3858702.1 RNA polymerase factor sigma-54 [Gammaproteobacteria bacterium]